MHRQVASITRPTDRPLEGTAFGVWAACFAVGVLFHEWQAGQPPFSVGIVVVLAAIAVILRPTSVVRLVVLSVALGVELVYWLPNPWNHLLLVGVVGAGFVLWWLGVAARSWSTATDPAQMYERAAPYLRTAFVLSWVFAAFAKLNTGFLDAASTCAVWILEGIPLVQIPQMLAPLVAVGTIGIELAVPLLLLFHRTRPLAIVFGFTFHLVSAVAGHAAFSGLAWSFYLLFLPPAVVVGAVATARKALPVHLPTGRLTVAREYLVLLTAATVWTTALVAVDLLPDALHSPARRWGAGLMCTIWLLGWGWVLLRARRDWFGLPGPGPRQSLAVRNGVLLLALGLLLLTAAMPYLGLKTRAAFTMYSNLRTDPGNWNHLIVPEAARVFDWQDGTVEFVHTDDPGLAQEIGHALHDGVAQRVLLADARAIVAGFPDAGLEYRLDGELRSAERIAADPTFSQPVSAAQSWLGAFRPLSDANTCLH